MQDALKALWKASFPERELPGLVSEQWKDMGWQGVNPSTDFRFVSIFHYIFCVYIWMSFAMEEL